MVIGNGLKCFFFFFENFPFECSIQCFFHVDKQTETLVVYSNFNSGAPAAFPKKKKNYKTNAFINTLMIREIKNYKKIKPKKKNNQN